MEEFFKVNEYIAGSYDKPDGFAKLNKAIEEKGSCNRIFYLALPPSVYETVTLNLKAVCMSKGWVIYTVSVTESRVIYFAEISFALSYYNIWLVVRSLFIVLYLQRQMDTYCGGEAVW